MKKIVLITLVLLIEKFTFAQTATVSGYIRDYKTGENLISASIYDQNTQEGTIANNYGFYSLTFKVGSKLKLTCSYIAYQNRIKKFTLTKDTVINFMMTSSNELDAVIVTADKSMHKSPNVSTLKIPMEDIKRMPSISGETDVLKVFQLMPGVQSGQEGSSALYVRGGSPDQNLYLIDDVPLYYVNHLGGFVSVFDDNAINSMRLIKGGFPARYGGRLSSVIDMRMKNGNNKEFHGEIKVGIASKIFIEGPIKKNKISFMLSARRSNIDFFSRAKTKINSGDFSAAYTFYDIYGKLCYKLSDKNSFFISTYSGRDRISVTSKESPPDIDPFAIELPIKYFYESLFYTKWGNQMATIRWNHLFGNKLFSNLSVSYSKFYYNTEKEYLKKDSTSTIVLTRNYNTFNSGINDLTARLDFDYYPNSAHKIKFGINAVSHLFNPGIKNYQEKNGILSSDTTFGNNKTNTNEANVYFEDEVKLGKRISFNMGFLASYYDASEKIYQSFQPRASLNVKLSNNFSLKSAYSKIEQNLHQLSNSGTGIPTDIWLPPTKELKPQESEQYVINATYTKPNKKLELSGEIFYKEMNNLIDFKESASYQLSNTDWLNIVETGGYGRVYGLELLIQRKQGKITGWLAYTLSKNERKYENINGGNYYPSKFDHRHDIAIVVNYRLRKNITLSANWVYTSGNMMTLALLNYNVELLEYPEYEYNPNFEQEPFFKNKIETAYYYGRKNNFRLPPYHRLDLNITFEKKKKRGVRTIQLGVYNAYFRKNIFFLYYKNSGKGLYKFTLFPIIPSFSYSFKF